MGWKSGIVSLSFLIILNISGSAIADGLQFCSKLSFSRVNFVPTLSPINNQALILAMNITGSFEGSSGWGNLTNNFDRQGLSMGLLNQNLGQGSLQPMMLAFRNSFPEQFTQIFSTSHLQSVVQMLSDWGSGVREEFLSMESLMPMMISKNTESVHWASTHLYQNGNFVPEWQRELSTLAVDMNYVSIQLSQAAVYANASLILMHVLNLNELKSFLSLFDLVVQGGERLSNEQVNEYRSWLSKNVSATETNKLLKVIEIRARSIVDAGYRNDFVERKNAIANGEGTVHQVHRYLQSEYCYVGSTSIN